MLFDDLLTVTRASVISGNNLSKNLFACGKTWCWTCSLSPGNYL